MMIYRLPFLSRIASLLVHLLPDRAYALIMIATLDQLDDRLRDMHILEEDGSETWCSGIDAIAIENWRRKLWKNGVKATLESR